MSDQEQDDMELMDPELMEQMGYGQEDMMGYGMEEDMDQMEMQDDEEYGQEEMDDDEGMDEGMMEGYRGYGNEQDDQDEDEESINFDDNPEFAHLPRLDKMRKIRREVMKTINDIREAHKVPSIYLDVFANKAANEYASFLLNNPEDADKAKQICNEFHVVGEAVPLCGFAILDDDEDHQGSLHDHLMDAHGLLLELEYELGMLANSEYTHIGIGFAFDKNSVRVVEFLTKKDLMISQLNQAEDGGVEARGVILNSKVGFYAARIASLGKMTKHLHVVGPPNIQFTKSTGNFILQMPGPIDDAFYCYDNLKVIQFYIRTS